MLLLGGGIEEGTSTLIVGAAGTGKSTLAAQFATAAAQRGQSVAMFLFDESLQTLFSRCDQLGVDLRSWSESGRDLDLSRSIPSSWLRESSPMRSGLRSRSGTPRSWSSTA